MPKPKTARANPALRWNAIRQIHVYLSAFVAPSLIFFAGTGALQTFRIPDQKTAPVLIQKLARAHKDDVFAVKPPRPKRPAGEGGHNEGGAAGPDKHTMGKPGAAQPDGAPAKPKPKPATEAVKWFFTLTSVVVILSTLLGLWMALAYHKRKAVMWALVFAGAAIPAVLLAL